MNSKFNIRIRRPLIFILTLIFSIGSLTAVGPPLWQQQTQLTADDGSNFDDFGFDIAISGNTAIIGAEAQCDGSAYIFVRNGAMWSLQQKLTGYVDGVGGCFGASVAISGDIALVGAQRADFDGVSPEQGAVNVFVRNGSTWSLQQILRADDGGSGHNFGSDVAMSGDTAIVGSWVGTYIFERAGDTWSQQQRLIPSGPVSISGETAIVSGFESVGEDVRGAVWVFVRNGAMWTEQQKLTADDHVSGDFFGLSIAISGETVIASYYNRDPSNETPGDLSRKGAYIFARTGGTWSQQQKLNIDDLPQFPTAPSIAISGENVFLGFEYSDGDGIDIYTRTTGTWLYQQRISDPGTDDDGFSSAMAISGGTLIVGAPIYDVGANLNQGTAYVFLRSPDTDGDSLPDDWEQNGVTIDGEFIDLPAMGADPMHKDIFVHADWMAPNPTGVDFKPELTAIKMVMDAFATAPVDNPDGETGINLHVDLGPDSIMNPVTNLTWGFYSQAGETPFQEELGTLDADNGEYEWYAFDTVKTERFGPAKRSAIFHYALFCNSFAGVPSSGLSRGNGAADFIISLGKERNATSPGGTTVSLMAGGTVMQQAGTFMHELGHNLGLRHGGGDNIHFKPNYLSVMNYYFQFPGLVDLNGQRTLDYSPAELPPLVQTNLDESVGISDPAGHLTLWNGPSRPDVPLFSNRCRANENGYYKIFLPGIGLDWNCDGELTLEPVSIRLVNDPAAPAPPTPDILTGFDDWANLRFDGGGRIGDLGFGGSDLPTTPIDELPVEQILSAIPPALLADELVAPLDVATVTPQAGAAPLTVDFDGSASTAVTGTIVSWSWNFGDGAAGSGAAVQHTYTDPGTYFASLHVTDSSGRVNLTPLLHRITVEDAPPPPPPMPPNLTPYQLGGWTDKLVVSNRTGTNTDSSPLLARDALYVDFAIINNGTGATAASFLAKIYVDDVEVHSFVVNPPLNVSAYTFLEDFPLGSLGAGQHMIRIVADANGAIAEGDETDNEYTKLIDVSPSTADFVSRQNGDWSDPCTWNVPDGNGNCGSLYPGPSDSVEITHAVTAVNGGACQSLKLSGSISTTAASSVANSVTVSGDAQILGGVVNIHLTVGGNTSVIGGGVLNKVLRAKNITVEGTFAGSGFIFVGGAGLGNTISFTNNGTVTVEGLTFGSSIGDEAFDYAIIGDGAWNIAQGTILYASNSLTMTGNNVSMNSGSFSLSPGTSLTVNGTLTYGGGSIANQGTMTINGGFTFNGTSFSNNGTTDIGDSTLYFNGDYFGHSGAVLGTGKIRFAPNDGSAVLAVNGLIGTGVTIASGTIEYQSGLSVSLTGGVSGPFVVDAGATFTMTASTLYTHGDVTINGAITRAGGPSDVSTLIFNGTTFTNNGSVGDIDLVYFNQTGSPLSQSIAGAGPWSPRNINIGLTTSITTVTLMNDVTFNGNWFGSATGSALNIGSHTLTLNNPTGAIGHVSGTGLVKIQSSSGETAIGSMFTSLVIDPALQIAAGTVRGSGIVTNGALTIDAGATLSLFGTLGMQANGNVTNNGTLNAFSDGPFLNFNGNTFTNNGSVTGNVYVNIGLSFGPPIAQNLGGTGSWAGSARLLIDSPSTTTLLNDFTYDGGSLFVVGRLITGLSTLAMPCTVTWSGLGLGDVIGNVRRTNLAACPGAAIAYGNPFTTIQFTSGTPPDEITFNIALEAPVDFPNAALRTYLITPFGDSGYTATLRLHYLDAELNGNAESTLQLWRKDDTGWNVQGSINRNTTNNWVELTGVTQFSSWTISGPANAPPVLSNITVNPSIINAGGTTTLSGNVTDGDASDTHLVVINWGDGLLDTTLNLAAGVTSFNANHQYAAIGNFSIAITATDGHGGSTAGGASITVTTVPDAPSNLTATAVSTTQINLTWTDNANNEGGFKIERCNRGKNCTNFVEIVQVGTDVAAFSNIGLANNTQHRYRVRAYNAIGNSAYSNIAAAKTPRK
jgi:hypothetical protein